MRILLSSLCILLALSACQTFTRDKESATLYLELGANQLRKGNAPGALASLLKAEKLDSNNPLVHNQLGMTYFAFRKFEDAGSHFRTATRLDPAFAEARNNHARALIELKRYKDARDELAVVLADLTYANQSLAHTNMGISFFKEGEYKKAIPFLQKAIKLNKANCLSFHYYARALYELRDYSGAIPVFDSALPLCKKIAFDEAHYYAALTYFKSGDKTKGTALMNETILLYPDGEYQDRARNMLQLMKFDKL